MDPQEASDRSTTPVVAKYWSGKFYRQCLGAVTAFLRPKLLSPEYYGVWTLLKLIPRYASYGHLGTRSALRYLIPLYRARGDQDTTGALRGTGFIFGLIVTSILSAGVAVLAVAGDFSLPVLAGLASMALLMVLQYYHHFLTSLLKAHEEFGVITRSIYVIVTLTFLTTIPLLYFFDIYGIYASVILAELGTICYLRAAYEFGRGGPFHPSALRELLQKGFPIIILNLAVALVTTCDRIVVGAMLGKEALGFYGIAIMGLAFLIEIPGTARSVMEPRLMRTIEQRDPAEIIGDYLISPLVKTAYLLPFLIGPAFLGMEAGVSLLLPRYMSAVPAARTLSLGALLLALAYVPRMLIIAKNWQLGVCWRLPPVLAVNVLLGIALVRAGYGLFGIALATIIAFGMLFLILYGFLRARLGAEAFPEGRWILTLIPPVLVMCGLISALLIGVPCLVSGLYLRGAISVLIYATAYWFFYGLAAARIDFLDPLEFEKSS
jgi:O-antigen/teichoic acid export membrane protein